MAPSLVEVGARVNKRLLLGLLLVPSVDKGCYETTHHHSARRGSELTVGLLDIELVDQPLLVAHCLHVLVEVLRLPGKNSVEGEVAVGGIGAVVGRDPAFGPHPGPRIVVGQHTERGPGILAEVRCSQARLCPGALQLAVHKPDTYPRNVWSAILTKCHHDCRMVRLEKTQGALIHC